MRSEQTEQGREHRHGHSGSLAPSKGTEIELSKGARRVWSSTPYTMPVLHCLLPHCGFRRGEIAVFFYHSRESIGDNRGRGRFYWQKTIRSMNSCVRPNVQE